MAINMKAEFLETCAKDNQCASDIFLKSLIQIEKVIIRKLSGKYQLNKSIGLGAIVRKTIRGVHLSILKI